MYVFNQKHFRVTTPFWLYWLVVGGIALRGGLAMFRELIRPCQDALAARLTHCPETSSRSDLAELSRVVDTPGRRDAVTKAAEELRDD